MGLKMRRDETQGRATDLGPVKKKERKRGRKRERKRGKEGPRKRGCAPM